MPVYKKTRLLVQCVLLGLALFSLLDCLTSTDKRLSAVDNSTLQYFPPIGKQEIGDCTCWSSAYYYNTYTQARDEGLDASTGDPEVICSPRFLFSLISMGASGAECTEHAMERLSDIGCAPLSLHPLTKHWSEWPEEEAWKEALKNRLGPLEKIRADSAEGLERVKRHIADGGCAVTRALFCENYVSYGERAEGPGIDNGVMYAKVGENWLRHSLCICGFDDNISFFDERDGQVRSGAFLIANSEGPKWGTTNSTGEGTRGFIWIAYSMFLDGEFGRYDNDDNPHKDPCYDNPSYPTVYFHEDRPHYRPSLFAVVGVNQNKRNLLALTGGIGDSFDAPEFAAPDAIEFTHSGEISLTDETRIVLDLSDGAHLIVPGKSRQAFVRISLGGSADSSATVTSADFYFDPTGTGSYRIFSSADPVVSVGPGETGFAAVKLSQPALR